MSEQYIEALKEFHALLERAIEAGRKAKLTDLEMARMLEYKLKLQAVSSRYEEASKQ